MIDLRELIESYADESLHQMILSGAKEKEGIQKVRIRPVLLKGSLKFQVSETVGTKEIHRNLDKQELSDYLRQKMKHSFKQMQMAAEKAQATVLVSKKGKMTIKVKHKESPAEHKKSGLDHNRKKQYLLEEGCPVPFLEDLGVMNSQGMVIKAKYDKFKQLNRFLEFIEDILPRLPKDREIRVLDFGCGKSYLTFAMYHYLHEVKGYPVSITGLDLKTDVIETCNSLAEKFGYEKLLFLQGDIASYRGDTQVDMVVTLHACDTATDEALAKAVKWGASVILSVPCCQHELNGQIDNDQLKPILSYGILKERFAALLTDGLRAEILENQGYDTQILEFIDMEHTPKNLLIRAVKRRDNAKHHTDYRACMELFHVNPTLERLLASPKEAADETNID